MWNSFIHKFVCFVHKLLCVENIFNTLINVWTYEIQAYEWITIILYIYVKCVFNAQYMCAKHMNLWINKLQKISITKSLNVKFIMYYYHINTCIAKKLFDTMFESKGD